MAIPSTRIVKANLFHVQQIALLGQRYHAECPDISQEYEPIYVETILADAVQDDNHFLRVIMHGSKAVGLFWGCIAPPIIWTRTLSAIDICFYIDPLFRGRLLGARLIKEWHEWAKGRGVEEVYLGIASGIETDKTLKLYSHFGWKESGVQYVRKD